MSRRHLRDFPSEGLCLDPADWVRRTDAALDWLRRSIEATGGRGSSHSWSPVWGWAKAYPETTGYLVETLRRYAVLKNDLTLSDLADRCTDWLLTEQLPNGAFPAGLAGSGRASVFNTAMVVGGLCVSTPPPTPPPMGGGTRHSHDTLHATEAVSPPLPLGEGSGVGLTRPGMGLNTALAYLLRSLSPDGAWRTDAYVPGFVPSYYTYAVWRVLQANQTLRHPEANEAMRGALHFYTERFLPNGAVRDWGFRAGEAAFTHTIAYTLQGFLEAALLLGEAGILEKTLHSGERLWAEIQRAGRTAGCYDEAWQGDGSFGCITGNAQLSVLFQRMWQLTGEPQFRRAAQFVLWEILDKQVFGKNPNTHGALPGSAPLWGPYLRLRYPNWAAKFFLDSLAAQL